MYTVCAKHLKRYLRTSFSRSQVLGRKPLQIQLLLWLHTIPNRKVLLESYHKLVRSTPFREELDRFDRSSQGNWTPHILPSTERNRRYSCGSFLAFQRGL